MIVHRIKNNKEVDIMTYVTLFLNKTKIQIKIRKLKVTAMQLQKNYQVQITKVKTSRGHDAISIGRMTQLHEECVTSTPTWVEFLIRFRLEFARNVIKIPSTFESSIEIYFYP